MSASVTTAELAARAASIRRNAIRIASGRGQGYVGQALGTAEILSCLFFETMDGEDRFVLSPGHYALALYAVLAETDAYDFDELCTYGMDGSRIEESPLEGLPGFEITGGSLAQGLSQAVGMALGKRLTGKDGRVFCVISDGELQEGQTWEAILAAVHHRLGNLVVILDRNHRQVDGSTEEVSTLGSVEDKFAAFGMPARTIDGHAIDALRDAILWATDSASPRALVCETTLGRGVPELMDADYPHYIRTDAEAWARALSALTVA